MNFKNLSLVFAILMLVSLFMISADTYNGSITVRESYDMGYIKFYKTAGSDSTASQLSRPIYIGDVNDADATIKAVSSAVSDANIEVHYSDDLINWSKCTLTNLDQTSTTMKKDTLGGSGDANDFWHESRYMVIEIDYQAGANIADGVRVTIVPHKDVSPTDAGGRSVNVMFAEEKSVTNPTP